MRIFKPSVIELQCFYSGVPSSWISFNTHWFLPDTHWKN